MAKGEPSILVIDDDEVVLAAIADLLEEARFNVRCQSSPAGAADLAAADPTLVAVVVDLNMPIMRGDNVARMFLSRASLRDLPLVLVSGDSAESLQAVRLKMPHVRVVPKTEMETRLVAVLREAIAERASRAGRRTWGSEPSFGRGGAGEVSPEAAFLEKLAPEMESAREVWREVRAGRPQRLPSLVSALKTLQGEADKRALFQAGQLLRGIEQIGIALSQGCKLRPSADSSVERAMDALAAMSRSHSTGPRSVADGIVDALRRALAELRTPREDA
jgi:CheY-like chemotaxis protein